MPHILNAGPGDIATIRRLARATWVVSYKDMISPEQIEYMLEMMYSPDSLEEQMNTGHQFLILCENDTACGFASYSPAVPQATAYRLHKLYVLPGQQGKGFGKILLNRVMENASAAGATALELNVNRNNPSLDFYRHEGFVIRETVDLDIGGGFFMNDYILEKNILL